MIKEIYCTDGRVVQGDDIMVEAEKFFKEFLQLIPEDFVGVEVRELQDLLQFRCTNSDNEMLTREVSSEEIKTVLFSMPKDKSPGPDGYTSEFYKATWDIIGQEFTLPVQSFFQKGFLPKGINSIILALIPKKLAAKEMRDYRPISCCNVLYKVISKIIANRLKLLLPRFIAENQSAFVKDRLLIENLLLATELVKDYHKDSISARCAIKIDISKAFDSVQWSFLTNTLVAMNFSPTFIHWINLCITTASFSVQVNGDLVGYFQSKRGLRQGCSLSPYLFVICMDVLSKMLDKAAGVRKFGFHPKCQRLGLTHLSFADDLMVLSDGKTRSIEGILEVFDEFCKRSGLRISLEKSTLYMAGVSPIIKQEIAAKFLFDVGQLPVRYLGLPLVTKRLTSADYSPLLEQIKKRIATWTFRFFSFAGRFNLIKSVLWSICNFWLAAFRLPRQCIREIDKLCSSFLWSGSEMSSHKAKISWDIVCKPKAEGGLGLRNLKEANDVSCLKLVWRIISNSNSLWTKWVAEYLIRKKSIWSLKQSTSMGSWIWRKILKIRDVAKSFSRVEVGNGESASFWYDHWSAHGRLIDTVGDKGTIDLGIPREASVADAWTRRSRRRHRTSLLNEIEEMMAYQRIHHSDAEDTVLWRGKNDVFKPHFSTRDTWHLIKATSSTVSWHKGVWFRHATPKYALCTWLAIHNRLPTGDRMLKWNSSGSVSGNCVLCTNNSKTLEHLFFSCSYASTVWAALAKGIWKTRYSTRWSHLLTHISTHFQDRVEGFLTRYIFQATIYHVWRERNGRRHDAAPNTPATVIGWIDKQTRNQITIIRQSGDRRYDKAFQAWLRARY